MKQYYEIKEQAGAKTAPAQQDLDNLNREYRRQQETCSTLESQIDTLNTRRAQLQRTIASLAERKAKVHGMIFITPHTHTHTHTLMQQPNTFVTDEEKYNASLPLDLYTLPDNCRPYPTTETHLMNGAKVRVEHFVMFISVTFVEDLLQSKSMI